ncbi:MAG TPA: MaoC/PaaZ C-terminal domain-containing protein [Acidimicrobiia bacterium]|jgi:acyl dehydratase|nr:MaoC/PaaZ C-terminal domain-containing protein [Acidimicrobiia bacterium]
MDRINAHFEDLQEGDEISDWPPVENVSRSNFVRYAGASGDFNPMHHDDTVAQKVGYPSVFGHGMFTAGVLGHYLTDWVGPGNLRKYAVQFKGQLYPGRTLQISAKVTRKYKEANENRIDADLRVQDDQGTVLITGTATAALPSRG